MRITTRQASGFALAATLCLVPLFVQPAGAVDGGRMSIDVEGLVPATPNPGIQNKPSPVPKFVTAPDDQEPLAGEEDVLALLDQARLDGDTEAAAAYQAQLDALYGVLPNTLSADAEEMPQTKFVDAQDEGLTPQDLESYKWLTDDVLVSNPAENQVKPDVTHASNGDLYAVVQSLSTPRQFVVYKSPNGGESWSWFLSVSYAAGNIVRNPTIAHGGSASATYLFIAYELENSSGSSSVVAYRWDLQNSTVSIRTIVSGVVQAAEIYPRIISDAAHFPSNSFFYLTYALNAVDYYPVYFSRTTDYGETWGAPVNVTGGAENSSWETRPDIAYHYSSIGSRVHIAFEKLGWSGVEWAKQIFVTTSANYGASWGTPVQVTDSADEQYHPRIAAGEGSNTVLVANTRDWLDSGDLDVNFSYSTDGGTTWAGPYSLASSSTYDESAVDLAVSDVSNGRFHAAYFRIGPDRGVYYRSAAVSAPIAWSAVVDVDATTSYASADFPWPAVTTDPGAAAVTDEAVVAWTDWRNSSTGGYYEVWSDGAGLSDPVVPTPDMVGVRRNTTFFLDLNGNYAWDGPAIDGVYGFGAPSDVPVTGDWNGDGVDDIGIRRNNTFFLDLNGNRAWDGPVIDGVYGFGAASDIPAIGDWNGDGIDDLGVRRNNAFFLDLNGNRVWDAGDGIFGFGGVSDLPVIGDWNGDGVDDLGVRRNNLFYLDLNGNRAWDAGDGVFPFGIASDLPVIGDWNADGIDDFGIRRPSNARFYLDLNGNRVWEVAVDGIFPFGLSGDTPLAGKW